MFVLAHMRANRQPWPLHPKSRMRRLAKVFAVLAVTLFLLVVTGAGNYLADTAVFYARVARLYTRNARLKNRDAPGEHVEAADR